MPTWTDMLTAEAESAYRSAEGLFRQVKPAMLQWKPATGENWMTTAQLLMHCTNACGFCCKGFVTGNWELPKAVKERSPASKGDDMLPKAEQMAAVTSIDEAIQFLADDKKMALGMIREAGEERLNKEKSAAPWGGPEVPLGQHLLDMIKHLRSHQHQLFYYLKLQGVPVNTMHLWGMA